MLDFRGRWLKVGVRTRRVEQWAVYISVVQEKTNASFFCRAAGQAIRRSAPMKNLLKKAVSSVGYELRRKQSVVPMQVLEMLAELRNAPTKDSETVRFLRYALSNLDKSKSQIFQDVFVLFMLGEKRNGYFVEFGAANGDFLSNTVLLERQYEWTGIVAEPGRNSHEMLRKNRNCIVDLRCVWTETNETLVFSENPEAELSTLTIFKRADEQSATKEYAVETISLNDLLKQHGAPSEIDYLSIDTEGSEYEILKAFDFSRTGFAIITVEHNYRSERGEIFSLLSSKGYKRIFENITMFDDWYVASDLKF
jgi:FkbM family methyltransferase